MTIRPGIEDADWEDHIRAALRGMWERSRRGLGFNLLGPGARAPGPEVYVGDAETWARWCSSALPDALVALRYGPPLRDFTVLVRRSR
jgi:hypothetical protein